MAWHAVQRKLTRNSHIGVTPTVLWRRHPHPSLYIQPSTMELSTDMGSSSWGDQVVDEVLPVRTLVPVGAPVTQRDLELLETSRDGLNMLFKQVRTPTHPSWCPISHPHTTPLP